MTDALSMKTVTLTPTEQEICELLVNVVETIHAKQPEQPKLVLRIAGGWVRDKLLGLESHDIDIAIDNMSGFDLAQHVNQYLSEHGYPVSTIAKISQNPERSKHLETATTSVLGLLVDFVNLRSETYNSDSRIPQIEYGTPADDALRRDITINALFYNIHTRLVEDFTGRGLADLRDGIVRTPLEPFKTFTDDPLRVLRVLRFASRFNYAIDEETANAIMRPEIKRDLDAKISRERVGVELEKMAAGPHPLLSIQLILRFGLYASIFRTPPQDEWVVCEDGPSVAPSQPMDYAIAESLARNVLELVNGDSGDGPASLLHSMPPQCLTIGGGETAMRRSLMLAAFLYPYHGLLARDKKKTIPMAYIVIRDGIKLSHLDSESTVGLHQYAASLASTADDCVAGSLDRKTLGLQIRNIGSRWPQSVVFAAALELLDKKRGTTTLATVTEKYKAYVDRVIAEDLAEAYAMKHIVDGKTAAKILGIKPGPALKGVLDRVMDWQLDHPQGTRGECEIFIKETIGADMQL
ncbi:CCA tRNA nucleotidyltransferase, mitochondrial [Coemansia sp. 'formosensis']|nr:CCA tRNA nucleotidyltransferase, mitochondrial [Coemansia sp. 'formosensis']